MGKLAIRGHETRGKEVIEILEMLGGKLLLTSTGNEPFSIYYINSNGHILRKHYGCYDADAIQYTLEEFLENFPYKIGDYARLSRSNIAVIIKAMKWENNEVVYQLSCSDDWWSVDNLKPYKEENMEERQYKELRMPLDDDDKLATEVTIDGNKIRPPKNHLIGKITKVNNGLLVEFVKKQPEYPKNYKECCNIVGGIASTRHLQYDTMPAYKFEEDLRDSLETLRKVIICRNAYWKITGEQMGLNKPWEPDYKNPDIDLYVIINIYNQVEKAKYGYGFQQCVLTFPTAEIRDVFYENFKDLIEECKELL